MKYYAFFLAILVLLYGSYSVSAIPLLDDSCASAIVVGIRSDTSGEISPAGDKDFYRVEAPSDGRLTVYTNSDMNTRGKLRDADCLEIASNSNSGPGLNFQMSEQVSQGVYYIEVYNSSTSETGSYALYVEGDFANDDHGNSCTSATTLESYNSMDSGQLSVYADHDFFKVVLPSAGLFTAFSQSDMNVQGKLRDSNCFETASNSNSGDGLNFLISTQLDAGTYYIEVYNSSLSENGPYALNVEGDFTNDDHGNSCGSATSVNTRSILGDLSVYGDRDFFRIELTSSDLLRVTTASNMNTQGKLRDANCFEIASNSNSGSGLNFLIDRQLDPGIYYIEVYNSRVSDKGAYEFIVESPVQFPGSQNHKLYLPSLQKR